MRALLGLLCVSCGFAPVGAPADLAAADGSSAPVRLRFDNQPVTSAVDVALPTLHVRVIDAAGMPVPFSGMVSMLVANDVNDATLRGTRKVPATDGDAVFADLSLDRAGTAYTLIAHADGLLDAMSETFDISPPEWTPASHGLDGGAVRRLAVAPGAPGTLYAGTPGGVWRSSDSGAHWTVLDEALAVRTIVDLTVDVAGTLWVATGVGVAKRFAGATAFVDVALPSSTAIAVAVAGADSSVLYVADGTTMLHSADGGQIWAAPQTPLGMAVPRRLAVDPRDPGTVYLATDAGVWRSTDGGRSLSPLAAGLGALPIEALVVAADGTAWAGAGGLYRLAAGDTTWSLVDGATGAIAGLAVTADGVLVAGAAAVSQRTTAGGVALPAAPFAPASVALFMSPPQPWLGSDGAGVFALSADGAAWTRASTDLEAMPVEDLASDAAGGLCAATAGGLFRTTDGGADWLLLDGSVAYQVLARDGTALVALSGGHATRSDDGVAWLAAPLFDGCASLQFDAPGSGWCVPLTGDGVVRILEGAGTRAVLPSLGRPAHRLAVDASGALWAATDDGLFRSGDGAASFAAAAGLPPSPFRAIAAAPSPGAAVWAATDDALYYAPDAASFTRTALPGGAVRIVAAATGPLWALGAQLWRSDDGGATFSAAISGLRALTPTALVDDGSSVYVGTAERGVFKQ